MTPRVLYIDDDPGLGLLVTRSLGRLGYDVMHVTSGEEGVAALQNGAFDVVALDHFMPGKTGLDVLPLIRALPNPPPVVYVTGSDDSRIAVAALKAGAVDYVWKDAQDHYRELLVGAISAALDTERLRRAKEASDREVRQARDRLEILLKEVNHRVANSLALIAGFARLQATGLQDPSARQALDEIQGRIHAVAGVHRRLYTSENVQTVEIAAYLASLVEDLKASLRTVEADHDIHLDAEPVHISTDRAVSLGVIVTELVTNAFKYAYPASSRGVIKVSLRKEAGAAIVTVSDEGVGMDLDAPPKGTGVGARIIRAMAANLDSKLSYDPRDCGACVTLTFNLAAL